MTVVFGKQRNGAKRGFDSVVLSFFLSGVWSGRKEVVFFLFFSFVKRKKGEKSALDRDDPGR